MTNYAKAVHGYNNSWTVSAHDYWTVEINKAWADMTNEEKMAEPYVMDHHFRELVEKGLWKPMSKIVRDHGQNRVLVGGEMRFVYRYELDCGHFVEVDSKDVQLALDSRLLIRLRVAAHKCSDEPKALPPTQDLVKGDVPASEVEYLKARVKALEDQLSWKNTEYAKLNEIYTKLADCWNAFQSTTKPLQRDVHRAEAAGEMARRLAELILRMVYNTGRWADILEILNSFSVDDAAHQASLVHALAQNPPKPR